MGGSTPAWFSTSPRQNGFSRRLTYCSAAAGHARADSYRGACGGSSDAGRQLPARRRIADRLLCPPNAAGGSSGRRPHAFDPHPGRTGGDQEQSTDQCGAPAGVGTTSGLSRDQVGRTPQFQWRNDGSRC